GWQDIGLERRAWTLAQAVIFIGWVTRRGEMVHQSQLRLRSRRSIFGRDTRSIQPGPIAIAAGVRLGCVLADAGYGLSASFRQGLTARKPTWAVGADVRMIWPVAKRGHLNPQDCFEHTTRWSRFAPRDRL